LGGVALLALTTIGILRAEPPKAELPVTQSQDSPDSSPFMQVKLTSSQLVLEGLVTENFELIAKGADQMAKMSEAAEWPRAPDKVYDHYSEEFRRLSSKLKRLAMEENLEGASFNHMHMTATCISCHNYVRKSLRVAKSADGESGTVRLIPSEWPELPATR
jgi:hypothetical protein